MKIRNVCSFVEAWTVNAIHASSGVVLERPIAGLADDPICCRARVGQHQNMKNSERPGLMHQGPRTNRELYFDKHLEMILLELLGQCGSPIKAQLGLLHRLETARNSSPRLVWPRLTSPPYSSALSLSLTHTRFVQMLVSSNALPKGPQREEMDEKSGTFRKTCCESRLRPWCTVPWASAASKPEQKVGDCSSSTCSPPTGSGCQTATKGFPRTPCTLLLLVALRRVWLLSVGLECWARYCQSD